MITEPIVDDMSLGISSHTFFHSSPPLSPEAQHSRHSPLMLMQNTPSLSVGSEVSFRCMRP